MLMSWRPRAFVPLTILVNVMMTVRVVVLHERHRTFVPPSKTLQDTLATPPQTSTLSLDFAMTQHLSATNVKTHPIQDTLAAPNKTLSSFSDFKVHDILQWYSHATNVKILLIHKGWCQATEKIYIVQILFTGFKGTPCYRVRYLVFVNVTLYL